MTARAITFGDVVRYATLPAILPRVRGLIGSGFGSFAFFMALVYRAVRLLPDGHPYLHPANMGRFGVIAVFSEAWRYIWFNRKQLGQKNIDQLIVFVVIFVAVLLLCAQFLTLALSIIVPGAMAFSFSGGSSFSNPFAMFDTSKVASATLGGKSQSFYDLSFMFLDRVFGVKGVFNSCISDGEANTCKPLDSMYGGGTSDIGVNDPATFPWPFHQALQGIFQFYSIGLLVVAIFLLVYFTIVVVAETAQTGTPFGKRFNTLWAPLRLVFAAGLLIPINNGFNAGQYIVFYAAKAGANFATNGWIGFNEVLMSKTATMVGADKTLLVARPQKADAAELVQFITLVHTCKVIEDNYLTLKTQQLAANNITAASLPKVLPYLVRPRGEAPGDPVALEMVDTLTYDDAVKWSLLSDIVIRFGIEDKERYKDQRGNIFPSCGEIVFPTTLFPALKGDTLPPGVKDPAYYHEGATMIARFYWDILRFLVFKYKDGEGYPTVWTSPESLSWNVYEKIGKVFFENYFTDNSVPEPDQKLRTEMIKYINTSLETILIEAQKREGKNASDPYAVNKDLLVRGWAAAGIWYNRIAEMNGVFSTTAWNLPQVSMYPATMEHLAAQKQSSQVTTSSADIFNPYVQKEKLPIYYPRGAEEENAATVYWRIHEWWRADGIGFNTSTRTGQTGNPILDIINFLFGTSGLFSIRENSDVHPLAQLSTIGKSLIDRSIALMAVGLIGTGAQSTISQTYAGMRTAIGVVSGFAFSILSIGATAGFVLYYIIPFLPFIYFFFAVAGWVKAIFEAMVGVPLWALAHIRIDGNGLPGDAAMNGYYLILEIMFRPILIVFGLIASVTIYAASVHVLNDIFNLAVYNVGGVNLDEAMSKKSFTLENLRTSIDAFFYTIVYVIIVYMLGMSSFKLIDLIPGSLLRWMGSGASPFQDSGSEAAGKLVSYGTMGGGMVFGQIANAGKQAVQGVGNIGRAVFDSGRKP